MTAPAPETIEREREKLYVTDAELIRRMGVPEKMGRAILRDLVARHPQFPKPQPLFAGRRYWPAVKLYFDRQNGLNPQDRRL